MKDTKLMTDTVPAMLKCPKCEATIPDKLVAQRYAQIGGKALAKQRGPEYYEELQKLRKNRRGGRPPKKKS